MKNINKILNIIKNDKYLVLFKSEFFKYCSNYCCYTDNLLIEDDNEYFFDIYHEKKLRKDVFNIFEIGYYSSRKLYNLIKEVTKIYLTEADLSDWLYQFKDKFWLEQTFFVLYASTYPEFIYEKEKKKFIDKYMSKQYISLLESELRYDVYTFVVRKLKEYKKERK